MPVQKEKLLSIGEAAHYLGISIDTLRNWDKQGKLVPQKTAKGTRKYLLSTLEKIRQERGLSSNIPSNEDLAITNEYLLIGDAARYLGVSIDTLRNWETQNKIIPTRTSGGQRKYLVSELDKVKHTNIYLINKSSKPFVAAEFIQGLTEEEQKPEIDLHQLASTVEQEIYQNNYIKTDTTVIHPLWTKLLELSVKRIFAGNRIYIATACSGLLISFFLAFLILARASNFELPGQIMMQKQVALKATEEINPDVLAVTATSHYLNFSTDLIVEGDLAVGGRINNLTISPLDTGFSISGGDTATKTLTVSANQVTLDQDLSTTSSPTFAGLTVLSPINAPSASTSTLNLTGTKDQITFNVSGVTSTLTWTPTSAQTITLPDSTTTMVGTNTTQTLTNKTISGSDNTISNIQSSALSGSYTGITGLGTITTGTWNGSTIGPTYGGTGLATYTTGDLLYSSASNTLANLAVGTSGQVLSVSSGVPTWTSLGASSIAADSIDFTEIADSMTLDANLAIASSASNYSINIDSGTLFVDTANNRIGINDTTPSYSLDVTGDANITGALTVSGNIIGASSGTSGYWSRDDGTNTLSTATAGDLVSLTGATTIAPSTGSTTALLLRAAPSGTNNIFEIQNNAGNTTYFSINSTGQLSGNAFQLTDAAKAIVGTAVPGAWANIASVATNDFTYRRAVSITATGNLAANYEVTLDINNAITANQIYSNTYDQADPYKDFRLFYTTDGGTTYTEVARNVTAFSASQVTLSFQLQAQINDATTSSTNYYLFYSNSAYASMTTPSTYTGDIQIDSLDSQASNYTSSDTIQFPLSDEGTIVNEGTGSLKLQATQDNIGAFSASNQTGLDTIVTNFGFLSKVISGTTYLYTVGGSTDGTAANARATIYRTSVSSVNGNVAAGTTNANSLSTAVMDNAVAVFTPPTTGGTGADGTFNLALGAGAGGCNGAEFSWSGSACTITTQALSIAGPSLVSGPRYGAHSFTIPSGDQAGKILTVFGNTGSTTKIYDPTTNTYADGPDLGANARYGAHSFTIPSGSNAGKILTVVGNGTVTTRIYDPATNTYGNGPNMTCGPDYGAHSFTIPSGSNAGKILTPCGSNSGPSNIYDPATNTFADGPNVGATVNYGSHSFTIPSGSEAGKVLTVTGSSTRIYDPATNTYGAGPALGATANKGAHSFTIPSGSNAGKILTVVGNGTVTTRIYDPATNTYGNGPNLGAVANEGAHSITISDGLEAGKILTIQSGGPSSIYDPATNTYKNTISIASGQGAHSFTIPSGSLSGKIFTVVGGGTAGTTIFYSGKNTFNFTTINIPAGTTLTTDGPYADNYGPHLLTLNATGNVTIGGTIDLEQKGYSGGTAGASGYGPGAPTGSTGGGCGGSYSAAGGAGGSSTCSLGNTYSQNDSGSGGGGGASNSGGAGGGGIAISSAGNVTVEVGGYINASGYAAGSSGASRGGGGSGGSIYLEGTSVTNNTILRAKGGNGGSGTTDSGGGGGGGKVTLRYTTSVTVGTIDTAGGIAGATGTPGVNGSSSTYTSNSINSIIYNIGGQNTSGTAQSSITQANIDSSDGSIGAFSASANNLSQTLFGHTANTVTISSSTYLYVVGGNNGTSDQTTVYKFAFDSSGALGAGSTTSQTQLGTGISSHATVTGSISSNNYIWVIGGKNGSTAQSSIYRGTIDASGDITALSTSSQTALPVPLYGHSAVFTTIGSNNYLFIYGGTTTGGTKQTTVYKATLDASGNVTSIISTGLNQLSTAISGQASFNFTDGSSNQYAYIVGGNTTSAQSAILKASYISPDQTTYSATRTISSIDLSNKNDLQFKVYSSRTGSYMNLQFYDATGGWQTCTFSVVSAGGWETKTCDISGVATANKNAVTSLKIAVSSSSTSSWTGYFDDIQGLTEASGTDSASALTSALGSANLSLNAQGTGIVRINYSDPADPTNYPSAAGSGGMVVYDGTNNALFTVSSDGTVNIPTGATYKINGTTVLGATTLGSGVVSSSLTSVGTITTGVWNGTDIAIADGGTGASTAADARTNLGLAIGTNVQAYDADLTTYAGITPSANVQTLLSAADYAAFKTSLSLNNVENTALSTWAGSSNITTTGALASGSIAAGFGNISTGNTITTTGTMGTAATTTFTGATGTFSTSVTTPLVIGSTSADGTLTIEGNNTTGNTATNANLIFKVGDSAGTTAMTILNNGNVGIGTTAPGSPLSVNGGISSGTYSATAAPANSFIISGDIGIGTTAPARSLETTGSIRMGPLITGGGGAAAVYRDANGDLADATSSILYKTDITPYENVLDKVMELEAVNFKWNEKTSTPGMNDFGMIAESVNTVIPDLVIFDDDGVTPHGLKYEKMGLIALKAIQELNNKLNSFNLSLDDKGNIVIPKAKIALLDLSDDASLASDQNYFDVAAKFDDIDARTKDTETRVLGLENQVSSNSAQIASTKSEIDFLKTELASLSAQIASNSANQYISSNSAQVSSDSASPNTKYDIPNTDLGLTPPEILLATGSAQLVDLSVTSEATFSGQLLAYQATISDTFKSLGDTFLGNTTIAGDFSVDGTLSLASDSLNSIGTLYLQSSPLADALDILNGAFTFSKDGTLTVSNTIITNQFAVKSDTTAGVGTILANQTDAIIENIYVDENSVILITPHTPLSQTMAVTGKVTGGFLVQLAYPESMDIKFDYIIIGVLK